MILFHGKNEVVTSITTNGMKEMLILCKKKPHFTFESRTYVQTDGVAMGSPLGPVLTDKFYDRTSKLSPT